MNIKKEGGGQLFSVRRLKTNWQNYKELGYIYTFEKNVHLFCISAHSTLSQNNKQKRCTLSNFFACYQSQTDHYRGKTLYD